MLNRGDLDLNSAHSCTDSLKQTLKQTMLNQELVFMRQVYELHRVYRIQIAMMEDLKQKGLDDYNWHKRGLNSISENQNYQAKFSMAECAQAENFKLQHEQKRTQDYMKKCLDLQLPADEFISRCVNEFSGKEVLRDSPKEFSESKNSSRGVVLYDVEDPKLSLTIGKDTGKAVRDHRSWMANSTCASSSNFIDLEDPYFGIPNNEAYLGLTSGRAALSLCSKDERKLESFTQSGMRDVIYGTPVSRSFTDIGPSCQRQAPANLGLDKRCREFLSGDNLIKNKTSVTCKTNNLDLNIVQPEEASYFSNNQSMVQNLSGKSFSGVSGKVIPAVKQANVNHYSETSDMRQQLDLNVDLAVSCGDIDRVEWNKDDECREGDGGKISCIDLDSDSGEDLQSSKCNPKIIESVGSSSGKVSNDVSCDRDMVDAVGAEANLERDAQLLGRSHACQNQMGVEHTNCHKLSSSSDSGCIIDHQSSSLKTMQSGVRCEDLSFSTSEESQKANMCCPADHSGEPDQKSSDSSESNVQCINRKQPRVDEMVQTAAEVLLQISLETPVCYQGGLMKPTLKQVQNEEHDQPQRSTESYEALVLNAKESDLDDYCVSSNAYVVDESEKKESRYKLKRGTRMKDFQKDVLPSLSVLSRQEIREDINIMEGVIRSREYKKMRGKMADGDDWCRPSKNKRSRVSRRYNR